MDAKDPLGSNSTVAARNKFMSKRHNAGATSQLDNGASVRSGDTMNLSRYVLGDPVSGLDPFGLFTSYECCSTEPNTGHKGKSQRDTLVDDVKDSHAAIKVLVEDVDEAIKEIGKYPQGTLAKLKKARTYLTCADSKLDSLGSKCERPGASLTCGSAQAWVRCYCSSCACLPILLVGNR